MKGKVKEELNNQALELKNRDFSKLYVLSSYIDAQDLANVWRVGQIIDINKNNITVAFDGWLPKWNEVNKNNYFLIYFFI